LPIPLEFRNQSSFNELRLGIGKTISYPLKRKKKADLLLTVNGILYYFNLGAAILPHCFRSDKGDNDGSHGRNQH